jgi:hypothetical protein
VDAIRNGSDECFEEGCGRLHIGLFNEFDHSELRGSESTVESWLAGRTNSHRAAAECACETQ